MRKSILKYLFMLCVLLMVLLSGCPYLGWEYIIVIEVVAGQGTTNPAPGTYRDMSFDSDFSFTAIPAEGWMLDKIVLTRKDIEDMDDFDGDIELNISDIDLQDNISLHHNQYYYKVYFKEIPSEPQTVTVRTETFTTTGQPGGGQASYDPYKSEYNVGDQIDFIMQPNSGYAFDHWKIYHVPYSPPRQLDVATPKTVTEKTLVTTSTQEVYSMTLADHTLGEAYFRLE